MKSKNQQIVFSRSRFANIVSRLSLLMMLSIFGFTLFSNAVKASEISRLESVEDTSFNTFKIANSIAFSASKKIYVEKVEAQFSKDWMNKFKQQTSRQYRKATLSKYAETLRTLLSEKLEDTGWTVIAAPETGVVELNAKLLNLHINAPEMLNMAQTLVINMGSSDLEVSVFDANKNLVLYIEDSAATGSPSESFIETNKALNFSQFNKVFNAWANNLTVYLNMLAEI